MVILIVATIVSMMVGDLISGAIIFAIIFPSGLLSYFQERRAGKIMESLLSRLAIHVEVIRNGVEVSIPADQLVMGDEVILRVGDVIAGDATVLRSDNLMIDESLLTGESFPVDKKGGSEIFSGTHVVGGKGRARITAIGDATKFGKIAREVSQEDVTTGFEKGALAFGFLLLRAMLVLVVGIFLFNLIADKPVIESVLFSLALAVGLTPQLLPVIISVSLSVGAKAMAEKKVLVKRLDAIEDLGLVNILCTDKSGTITTGELELQSVLDVDGGDSEHVKELALLNSKLQTGFLNAIDLAIVRALDNSTISHVGITEIPYDFQRRRLSILVDLEERTLITKGAFENVLLVSNHLRKEGKILDLAPYEVHLRDQYEILSDDGKRVLGVASKAMPNATSLDISDESAMIFEGFLIFEDPLKSGAVSALEDLRKLGIDIYLITGDNHLVAQSIGLRAGFPKEKVLTGKELDSLDDLQLRQSLTSLRILAEIDPLQKERIVKTLRGEGATVGFFGDGINDSAALHAADVGISVDTAVDVAKSAASVVLLEKDLTVIADGIRLGRRTFLNTLKYVRVGISAAFGNVFSMAVADLFLPFLPLLPTQILLLNFMTDFPAVTISGDSVDKEAIAKPQIWDMKQVRKLMIIFGLISTLFDLLTFAVLRIGFNASAELFRSGWFVESTLTELTAMLVLRTNRRFWRSPPGKGLLISSAILAVLTVALPFTYIGELIGLIAIPISILCILFGLIALYIAINEFAKVRWWR